MQIKADNPDTYTDLINDKQRPAIIKLREVINAAIPEGFKEETAYGMMGWCVPHSIFPAGYHCNPKQPLPFAGIAAQKNFIAVYHMGIYAIPELLDWFVAEHAKRSPKRLDMGKSCIRYKKPEDIPYDLIGELFAKLTVNDWVKVYQDNLDARSKKKG